MVPWPAYARGIEIAGQRRERHMTSDESAVAGPPRSRHLRRRAANEAEGNTPSDGRRAGGKGQGRAEVARPQVMADGNRLLIGPTRSGCWRSRRRSRVPELVPIRYGRMLVSPFTFFGARPTRWPPISPARRGPGLTCSCAAMRTSRTSAASLRPTGRLVFNINDFDETLPGPSSGTSSAWRPASR